METSPRSFPEANQWRQLSHTGRGNEWSDSLSAGRSGHWLCRSLWWFITSSDSPDTEDNMLTGIALMSIHEILPNQLKT